MTTRNHTQTSIEIQTKYSAAKYVRRFFSLVFCFEFFWYFVFGVWGTQTPMIATTPTTKSHCNCAQHWPRGLGECCLFLLILRRHWHTQTTTQITRICRLDCRLYVFVCFCFVVVVLARQLAIHRRQNQRTINRKSNNNKNTTIAINAVVCWSQSPSQPATAN